MYGIALSRPFSQHAKLLYKGWYIVPGFEEFSEKTGLTVKPRLFDSIDDIATFFERLRGDTARWKSIVNGLRSGITSGITETGEGWRVLSDRKEKGRYSK